MSFLSWLQKHGYLIVLQVYLDVKKYFDVAIQAIKGKTLVAESYMSDEGNPLPSVAHVLNFSKPNQDKLKTMSVFN